METLKDLITKLGTQIEWEQLIFISLRVLLIFFLAWVAALVVRRLLNRLEKHLIDSTAAEGEPPSESEKRVQTIVKLTRQATLIALWVTVVLIVLRQIGVDIAPILASVGILGLAVGFGAQNLVRDVISGFFMILENQVRIGDVATLNGTGGLVEQVNFRTVVLRDLAGVVHVFPNGSITTLSNLTREWSAYVFEIGVAYKEDTDRVIEVLTRVGRELKGEPAFGRLMLAEPEIFGVDKFDDSAVVIKGRIKTRPIKQWEVGRQFLRRVKRAFDAEGIEIPFPHRTLYVGEATKPFELRVLERLRGDGEKEAGKEAGKEA